MVSKSNSLNISVQINVSPGQLRPGFFMSDPLSQGLLHVSNVVCIPPRSLLISNFYAQDFYILNKSVIFIYNLKQINMANKFERGVEIVNMTWEFTHKLNNPEEHADAITNLILNAYQLGMDCTPEMIDKMQWALDLLTNKKQ